MATSGPKFATVAATVEGTGLVDWTNPNNAKAQDDVSATATLNSGAGTPSFELRLSGYNFDIPATATIVGITATIRRTCSVASTVKDIIVGLIRAGVVEATNKGVATSWPSPTLTDRAYGSSTDLWSAAWTPSDVNDSGFGVRLQARSSSGTPSEASVDSISITVDYTVPASSLPTDGKSW